MQLRNATAGTVKELQADNEVRRDRKDMEWRGGVGTNTQYGRGR